MLKLDRLAEAVVATQPFTYLVAKDVLDKDDLARIKPDFPQITQSGVFPLSELTYGPQFERLILEIKGREIEEVLERKLDVDLSDKPLMVTVRGCCHRRDGRIHTDSTDKIVTCLLYLNDAWDGSGGRLRLLRSGDSIEDILAEVPPDGGTLVAFKRSHNSWHGHLPFVGQRRYVMFNWVRSDAVLMKHMSRARITARVRRLNPFS